MGRSDQILAHVLHAPLLERIARQQHEIEPSGQLGPRRSERLAQESSDAVARHGATPATADDQGQARWGSVVPIERVHHHRARSRRSTVIERAADLAAVPNTRTGGEPERGDDGVFARHKGIVSGGDTGHDPGRRGLTHAEAPVRFLLATGDLTCCA